jgi:hypothetical protein
MGSKSNRDDFLPTTKRILAERVAWRCSYPGCLLPTVGPHSTDETKSIRLGEAAHITAASPEGPRHDERLTIDERRHASNGIWMCRPHAKLVDFDEENYSVGTLRQWKVLAERRAYEALEQGKTPAALAEPNTLIALGLNLVLKGVWLAGGADTWRFRCSSFYRGNQQLLRDETVRANERLGFNFIVVESQGDGRLVSGPVEWEQCDDGLVLTVPVHPRAARRDPTRLGCDLALGKDGDLVLEAGSFKTVDGVNNAIQKLSMSMSIMIGEWFANRKLGSLAALYYHRYGDDAESLGRLLKLEFARLATIPLDSNKPDEHLPPLNFVWRVNDVTVPDLKLQDNRRLKTVVDLEWASGEHWSGEVLIYIHENLDQLPDWVKSS